MPDSNDIDADASPHDLLNEATEWMRYAGGIAELLGELVHESDAVDCRRMALALEAIGAIARVGAQRTAQAHALVHWQRARAEGMPTTQNI
ncbi:hypothetical protein C8J98_101659 [Luteibacter sp. OK325]|uniref:hypothetical protein n=1 Tax=Luteibacter sp. OK325 TaxID=2135670 RepID=UPI000D38B5FE|nr:hypothetical protein [Luteibacter sp. OK325]PTR35394.1 hypothetical protein C8J98_101659 [Luteibacter sp. OK325]